LEDETSEGGKKALEGMLKENLRRIDEKGPEGADLGNAPIGKKVSEGNSVLRKILAEDR